MRITEKHVKPQAGLMDTEQLPEGTLVLLARATAEQHAAIMELRSLFAKRGGILTDHFLTAAKPARVIKELEDCRSFAVLNFSPVVTVQVGFGGSAAVAGGGMPVPPQSFIQLPVETNLAELAASVAELETVQQAMVFFIRFRHLVHLEAGPLNSLAGAGAGARETVAAVTGKSPRSVAVGAAAAAVIAANAERKGLEIQNTGPEPVSLGLGAAAVIGDDVVLAPGASWNGTISGVLWRGAINAIAAKAGNSVAVVEV